MKLAELCKTQDLEYGWQSSDVRKINSVVYFELPGMEQISFHSDLSQNEKSAIPQYKGKWDGKMMSTLGKIESTIMNIYGELLAEKYKPKEIKS